MNISELVVRGTHAFDGYQIEHRDAGLFRWRVCVRYRRGTYVSTIWRSDFLTRWGAEKYISKQEWKKVER